MTLIYRTRYHAVLASTNTAVKSAIEAGQAEGRVVQAGRQTAGYGRRGHVWESPAGGLYMSLLLRPAQDDAALATLPLVAGMAVHAACEAIAPGRFAIKWPNDVVVPDPGAASGFVKIAGISCERYLDGVCLGVGVDAADLPLGNAIALPPAPETLRDMVLARFAECYERWQEQGFAPFAPELSTLNILRGRTISVQDGTGRITCSGVAGAMDETGRLCISSADGGNLRVSSGEAHILL